MAKERRTSKLYWGSEEQRLAGLWEVSSKARVDSEPVLRGQGWEGSKLEVIITEGRKALPCLPHLAAKTFTGCLKTLPLVLARE